MSQEQPMTRRERRLLKRQEAANTRDKQQNKRAVGKYVLLAVVVVLILGAVYGLKRLDTVTPDTAYTDAPVHWHAAFDVKVCGEDRDLPAESDGTAHGKSMAGTTLSHHHFDNIMHIEGRVINPEDIKIGAFADRIGFTFDRDRLMEKTNGEACSEGGASGQVKMFVNDVPNNEFRDYIPKPTENASEQVIRLVFE